MGLYPAKKEGSPLTMKRRTSRWKEHATDLAFDLAGSFLMGVGVYTFAFKGGFATGGLSGMALIINYLWGLPVGMVTLALNVPLVLLTWRTLGRGFFLKSLRTMVISTVIIDFVLPLFPVYEGSRLLAAGFSGVLMGAGLSLIYMRGSSTGGGSGKLVLVITNEGQAVSRAIDAAVERGSTLVDVTGSYSGLPRRMVMCACSNNEVFKVRTAAHRVDPRALVMICEASEVFGEGFRAPEVGEKTG